MTLSLLGTSTIAVPHIDYSAIGPELVMIVGALVLLTVAALVGKNLARRFSTLFTVLVGVVSLLASLKIWFNVTGAHHVAFSAVDGAVVDDGFSAVILMLVSIAVIFVGASSEGYLSGQSIRSPEFSVLMMLSASGAMLMGSANDLIVMFLGLEIMSIALYVLAGSDLRKNKSGEAALKYFILGGFSSAIFLYGIALVYGSTGSTNLAGIAQFLATTLIIHQGVLLAGLGLMIVGFAFKVGLVPFHTWAPDVYQGSPTPATSFMAAVAKAGGFAGFLRVVFSTMGTLKLDWEPIIWVLAVITLVVGSIMAIVQRDIKRMLAYSSISHAGFILVGLVAATASGIAGSLYYLFAYLFMVVGSFTIVGAIGGSDDLEDYRGLIYTRPFLATGLGVLLLAQSGIPFTTGFWAKFEVVSAAVDAHSYAIALIAMVSAVIGAFFYLRVVVFMVTAKTKAQVSDSVGEEQDVSVGAQLVPSSGVEGGLVGGGPEYGGDPTYSLAVPSESGRSDEVDTDLDDSGVPERIPVGFGVGLVVSLCVGFTVLFGLWASPIVDLATKAKLVP